MIESFLSPRKSSESQPYYQTYYIILALARAGAVCAYLSLSFLPSPRKNAGKSKDSPCLTHKLPIDKKYMIRGKMMIAIKRFYKGDIDKTVICIYLSFKTSTMIHSFIEFVK